ncbi:hypothetical protein [uncultured Mediterranea sp.]|uniref:hypothetical protein n=1 Tax=uncultured Mediterranea sp. TaxID=1926662 RepID=UPI0027D93508|nr:hypothetical protein [uncultured Mediterranea sp.]
MSTFALEEIEAVKGKQVFHKLVIDNECPFDKFEAEIETCYKSELVGIYAIMNQVANLKSVPYTKFHFYDQTKGEHREFEFKSKHLRVYGITQADGKIIITGGTKTNQKKDETLFRKYKKDYIEFKQQSDKSSKP